LYQVFRDVLLFFFADLVALTHGDGSRIAIENENNFASSPEHMHVSRLVINRIDHDAEGTEPKNCRHIAMLIGNK